MEEQRFCIRCRYQKWTRNGIEWTDWFNSLTDGATTDKNHLLERISDYIKRDKTIRSKLKHEYKIDLYEEPEEVHAFQKMYKRKENKAKKLCQGTSKSSKT